MKLCRCGRLVANKCSHCYTKTERKGTTKERGYGHQHRMASERYRAEHPLCERCCVVHGVIDAQPSRSMHHIHKLVDAPLLAMNPSNWLALCDVCHEICEADVAEGMRIKRESESASMWSNADV